MSPTFGGERVTHATPLSLSWSSLGLRASGSTSTPMCSTQRSCQRSTAPSQEGSLSTSWYSSRGSCTSSSFAAGLEITVFDLTSTRMRSAISTKTCRCTRRCLRLAFSRHSGPAVVSAAPTPTRRSHVQHFRIRMTALGIEENRERHGDPRLSRTVRYAPTSSYTWRTETSRGGEPRLFAHHSGSRCPKGIVAARPQ